MWFSGASHSTLSTAFFLLLRSDLLGVDIERTFHTLVISYVREDGLPIRKHMGPGGIFARVAQWLANEVIVKGLANNPAFQRFAVRSAQQAKELSKTAAETAKSIAESENVSQLRKESQALREQANDFASALREEIQDAMRGVGQGKQPPSVSRKN